MTTTPRGTDDIEDGTFPSSFTSSEDETFSFTGRQNPRPKSSFFPCLRSYVFRRRLSYAAVAVVCVLVGALVWLDDSSFFGFGKSVRGGTLTIRQTLYNSALDVYVLFY